MFCSNCKKEIISDSVYCNHCGKEIMNKESITVNELTASNKIDKGRLFGGIIFGLILLFFGWMLHSIKGESFVMNLFSKILLISCIGAFILSLKEIVDKIKSKKATVKRHMENN